MTEHEMRYTQYLQDLEAMRADARYVEVFEVPGQNPEFFPLLGTRMESSDGAVKVTLGRGSVPTTGFLTARVRDRVKPGYVVRVSEPGGRDYFYFLRLQPEQVPASAP